MIWIATLPVSGDTGEGKSRNIPLSTFRLTNHPVFLIVNTLTPRGGSEASTDGDILQLDILHESSLIKGFG